MRNLKMPAQVYKKGDTLVYFNQLGLKIEMDSVTNKAYYEWLDSMKEEIGSKVRGTQIAEKENARVNPPLNTAIYYDTPTYQVLPTGALLRTSCNKITHAFCAFKDTVNEGGVRNDHRYVFEGDEKSAIQQVPASEESVAIVKRLLNRTDIEHPGTYLWRAHSIDPKDLMPAICLNDYRFTFFVWIDGQDALRCSIDRYHVSNLRIPIKEQEEVPLSEVELAVYPRVSDKIANDPRIVELIEVLSLSLCERFGVSVTEEIKYQRSAKALGIFR